MQCCTKVIERRKSVNPCKRPCIPTYCSSSDMNKSIVHPIKYNTDKYTVLYNIKEEKKKEEIKQLTSNYFYSSVPTAHVSLATSSDEMSVLQKCPKCNDTPCKCDLCAFCQNPEEAKIMGLELRCTCLGDVPKTTMFPRIIREFPEDVEDPFQ